MSVRFAPSPTGTFHIGNLRTAWISWTWARALQCPWVVRFEDIDGPRSVPGAQERQLDDLAVLGMVPDLVYNQSHRAQRHFDLFQIAREKGLVYPCNCSRKEVRESLERMASAFHGIEVLYDGHCRRQEAKDERGLPSVAWRFRGNDNTGAQDFIVGRSAELKIEGPTSFHPSYHWACAIDDWDGKYQLLVRAWDLENATPLQRQVQQWLKSIESSMNPFSAVYHAALVVHPDGSRLEKRSKGITRVELLDRGMDSTALALLFSKSYSYNKSDFYPSRVWGENVRTISLPSLGLDPHM